jgi:uncharacterized protein YbjT (DUF2867 family)
MAAIKNVAIAGASGSLGSVIFTKLVDSGKFNIRVLKRSGSEASFPAGTDVVEVDFSSLESLTSALKGQDALISTLGNMGLEGQTLLVDAAIAAGVTRFLPSEFGSNLDNPKTRSLPVFGYKVKTQEYILEKVKTTHLTYTFVYNSAFLDWGLQHDFILKTSDYQPTIIDDGDAIFTATTIGSVGDAIVGILTHPEETKNRSVYIGDIEVSQNQLLALAKKIAPEKPWEPVYVKLDDLTAKSDERLAKGLYDMETFAPYLFRAVMDPAYGGRFVKTDNELLGVKGKTEEDIIEIMKSLIH